MNKIIYILFLLLFINKISLAEIIDFGGDFSSRSVILNQMNASTSSIPQEIKDIIKNKKLIPTTRGLIEQIEKNNIENVKILLDAKLKPNELYYGVTPLFVACKKNYTDIAMLLFDYGAKPDKSFESELYEAIKNKNSILASYLITHGANVNYATPLQQKTILYVSLKNKMYEISKILIEKGAKPDDKAVKYIAKHKLYYLIPNEN